MYHCERYSCEVDGVRMVVFRGLDGRRVEWRLVVRSLACGVEETE
jgi:hypothetical protein